MHTTTRWILATLLLTLLANPARAGDDEAASPAEQAYQAGFWAETGSGELDAALAYYERALRSEGPAGARARALYRTAIVLERIGKTPEAIRALERLAQEFPQEKGLLGEAQARLEAWTAVDLRTSFAAWYERYQYSPAFQAHVVELVLKLSVEGASRTQAFQEILAIGAPAVQALRAHMDSPNESLRGGVVSILLRLGEIPSASALAETTSWRYDEKAWSTLLGADDETREALRAALPEGADNTPLLREVLQGIDHVPAALDVDPVDQLLFVALDRHADRLAAPLRARVATPAPAGGYSRGKLAEVLLRRGLVPDALALDWLRTGPEAVGGLMVDWIYGGALRDASAWEALVARVQTFEPKSRLVYPAFRALYVALDDAPEEADLTAIVREVERLWKSGNMALPAVNPASGRRGSVRGEAAGKRLGPGALRFLRALAEGARDERIVRAAIQTWQTERGLEPGASTQLLAWARREHSASLKRWLVKEAGESADEATLSDVLSAAVEGPPGVAAYVLDGLDGHRSLMPSAWTPDRLCVVLDLAHTAAPQTSLWRESRSLLQALLRQPRVRARLLDLALVRPSAFPRGVLSKLRTEFRNEPGFVEGLQERFRAHWPAWSLERQNDALWLFAEVWTSPPPGSEAEAFLRSQLHVIRPKSEAAAALTRSLARQLPKPTLEDVRAAFDLSTPQGAAQAMKLPSLPRNAQTYEALRACTGHPDAAVRSTYYRTWMVVDALESRIFRDQIADPDDELRVLGIQGLLAQGRNDAVPLLVKALTDEEAYVRTEAAKALGVLYDRGAIQALARALDDEFPEVRAAALASLEAIQKVEEQKAYWKKFAEGAK